MPVIGLSAILNNLNREIKTLDGRIMKGLIRSAILVRRSTEETPPLTPVDMGNLKASWFTVPLGLKTLQIGYTASYAVFVHENMEAKNWSRPGSGPKWFEAALKRNRDEILKIIREEARFKK